MGKSSTSLFNRLRSTRRASKLEPFREPNDVEPTAEPDVERDVGRDVDLAALTELYCGEHPEVDIVAVHGLNGSAIGTFKAKGAEQSWLEEASMLPRDMPRCRVLTFNYPASVATILGTTSSDRILQHAQTLIAELVADRELNDAIERPIIFICHSLGGIIVKRALVYSASRTSHMIEHLHSIYVSTSGILFFGVPHLGSDKVNMARYARRVVDLVFPTKLVDTESQLLGALEAGSEALQEITDSFAPLMKRFQICFFWEQKKSDIGATLEIIIPEHSAAPILDSTDRAALPYDHRSMCKFASRNAPGYKLVIATIRRYASRAPATIPGRWASAKAQMLALRRNEAHELLSGYDEGPAGGLRLGGGQEAPARPFLSTNKETRALPDPDARPPSASERSKT